jgi:hypothetical protein
LLTFRKTSVQTSNQAVQIVSQPNSYAQNINVQQVQINQNQSIILNQSKPNHPQQQTNSINIIRNQQSVQNVTTSSNIINQNNQPQQFLGSISSPNVQIPVVQNSLPNSQSSLPNSSTTDEDEMYNRKIEELKHHLPRLKTLYANSGMIYVLI